MSVAEKPTDSAESRTHAPHSIDEWIIPRSRWAILLEKLALTIEHPVNRLIGNYQLNPFYHTGTIAVLLLAIVGLTGIYLWLFFQFGFEESYAATVRMENQLIARTMRAIHRYASGALIVTTLLHGYRILFMQRFKGPRWLAWVTGVFMTFLLWLAGVTGYWLIWDQRAQLITEGFVDILQRWTTWAPAFMVSMVSAETNDRSWLPLLIIFIAHLALFIICVVLTWLHIRRLSRPRWIPDTHWIVIAGIVLLVISLLFPAGNLPAADFTQQPTSVDLDPLFLFYFPINKTWWSSALWITLTIVTVWAVALPWLRRKNAPQPLPVIVTDDLCTGCTKCANDCPYDAIVMVERPTEHRHKLLAVADASKCVSCGICIGSCDDYAITLGDVPPQLVWATLTERLEKAKQAAPAGGVKVIFTCERHAVQGARPYLNGKSPKTDPAVEVIALPCAGVVLPSVMQRTLEAGAAEVEVVGCPPHDCANREGNMWEEQRLTHERVPRLRKAFDHKPITAAWIAPNEFERSIPATAATVTDDSAEPDYLSARFFQWLNWRNFVIGFALLAAVLVAQVWLTGLSFTPVPQTEALVQIVLDAPAVQLADDMILQLTVDGEVVLDERVDAGTADPRFTTLPLAAGTHHIRLAYSDPDGSLSYTIFEDTVSADAGMTIQVNNPKQPDPLCPVRACTDARNQITLGAQ
ncbi:MAG: hydrogenase iron-sulfur subunit [Anaerolineae bacterium]|nr:hydrogenase iron-sulfur subunit [Anaerolineae bacterium]